jgi:uncharacterized protein YbdZ (MbtH family)
MGLGRTIRAGWPAALLGAVVLTLATQAFAGTQTSACGRYSLWVPDNWRVSIEKDHVLANSRDNEIWLEAAPLDDKDADLIDDDVVNFVKADLENVKFTSDRRDKFKEFPVRLLEGTGEDEGNKVTFRALALDPGGNEAVIEVLVYADRTEMNRSANKSIIDRVFHSLTPAASPNAEILVNACGRYSVWIPNNWKVSFDNERLHAISRDGQVSVIAAPLSDEARLLDLHEYVTNFVEEELEGAKFTSDRRDKLGDFQARMLEGTAGEQLAFKAVALDPGSKKALIELLIFADHAEMNRPANKAVIDQILRSFKPS